MRDQPEFDSTKSEEDTELTADEREQVADGMARWMLVQKSEVRDIDGQR